MTATKTIAPQSSSVASVPDAALSSHSTVDKNRHVINNNHDNGSSKSNSNNNEKHTQQQQKQQNHNHGDNKKDKTSKNNHSDSQTNIDDHSKENTNVDNPPVIIAINANTNTNTNTITTTTTTNSTLATLSPPSLAVPLPPSSNPFQAKMHHSQTQPQTHPPTQSQSQSQSQSKSHSHPHPHPHSHSHPHPQSHVHSPASIKPATSPRHTPSHSDPVLPRNSRVRIVGNNRTKWDLIGRVGVVRAAQTLGGWHEVELADGGIVRVQRNALTVLQLPPDDPPSSAVRIQANHPKQLNHQQTFHSTQQPHQSVPFSSSSTSRHPSSKLPLNATNTGLVPNSPASRRQHQHSRHYNNHYQQYHQRHFRARPLSGVGKVRDGVSPVAVKALHANISKLHVNSLHRYRSAYNLNVAKDCSKDELVGAVSRHFQRVTVNESEVISNFLRYLARHGGPAARD